MKLTMSAVVKLTILLSASAVLLAACAHNDGEFQDATSGGVPAETVAKMNGEAAYSEYCAGCHETGMLGAPVAGDAVDWSSRSQLWDAVLLDHAITGYLEMPAKGGRVDLPDAVVRSAVDYMLRMTFPDMPQDCNPPLCSDANN